MPDRLFFSDRVVFCPIQAADRLTGPAIHPGFGIVSLCRNGVEVLRDAKGDKLLGDYERRVYLEAKPHKPTPVWTLHIDGPFESHVYALTPDGEWTLIDRKDGFA